MIAVVPIAKQNALTFRDLRLCALQDSLNAFSSTDNSEHIPRVERIAESIRTILWQEGAASSEANQASGTAN